MVIRVHWFFLEPIIAKPIIRVFTWTHFSFFPYHGFQILIPQWNTFLNLVTYHLISSYLFFEICEISYSLPYMFHIFGWWFPCNKTVVSECKNVFFNIKQWHNNILSIHNNIFTLLFYCYLINHHIHSLDILNI